MKKVIVSAIIVFLTFNSTSFANNEVSGLLNVPSSCCAMVSPNHVIVFGVFNNEVIKNYLLLAAKIDNQESVNSDNKFAVGSLVADEKVEEMYKKAAAMLNKTFPSAEYVKWSLDAGYVKASFLIYGRGAQALFNTKGELLGTVRNVLYTDLPIKVMIRIKNKFSNAVPFAISEINRIDGTWYQFSVEKGRQRYRAVISPEGDFNNLVLL